MRPSFNPALLNHPVPRLELTSLSSLILAELPIAASGMIFFGNPVNFNTVTSVLIGFFSGRECQLAVASVRTDVSSSR